jgi:RNA polymerase sigma-70 factor (ECF subfamily)
MMLAYSQRRLGYNEVARDAVSEALARTVKTIARMDDLGTLPEAWCFGILRNVVIDAQRRSYRERRIHATADPSETLELNDDHEAVRRAFGQLSDLERELLELRVVAGLSSEHVASVLDMSPGAVRMAQARALDKLRGLMPQDVQP